MYKGESCSGASVLWIAVIAIVAAVIYPVTWGAASLFSSVAAVALILGLVLLVVKPRLSVAECEDDLKFCARTVRDFAREHDGCYPTQQEFNSLISSLKLYHADSYEYIQAPPGSPTDFVTLRCRNHTGILGRPLVLELQLNGTVRQC